LNQLALIRESLSNKSVPEQDFFVRQAEEEIRKQIKTPPFTPAPKVEDIRGSRPISCATKGGVERELAPASISRMTYKWMLGPAEDSPWNLAVVEVMSRKSIEWMRLLTCIDDDMASQAPTIIQRWLCGKFQEIQKKQNQDAREYNTQKKERLAKAQFTRWRKKVCFDMVLMLLLMFMLLVSLGLYGGSRTQDGGELWLYFKGMGYN
jgi:hypothetical protein